MSDKALGVYIVVGLAIAAGLLLGTCEQSYNCDRAGGVLIRGYPWTGYVCIHGVTP